MAEKVLLEAKIRIHTRFKCAYLYPHDTGMVTNLAVEFNALDED